MKIEELKKKIARIPTRDKLGEFRHIEVYRDEILNLLKGNKSN